MLRFALRLAACLLAMAFSWWFLGKLGKDMQPLRLPLSLAFTSPLWAWQFSPYVIEFFPAMRRAARHAVFEQWSGRYYVFQGRQIRFCIDEGTIWIVELDVLPLLDPAPGERELRLLGADYGEIPDREVKGFTEAGLMRMVAARAGGRRAKYDMIQFRRWLETEALPNVRRLPRSAL